MDTDPLDEQYIRTAVEKYSKTLYRICFTILTNNEDAEDAVQDTFIKYMTKAPSFENEEHEKAWLIKVATNISLNINRFRVKHTTLNIDEIREIGLDETDCEVMSVVLTLPAKYKVVMDLHYIEGYTSGEIANIIGVSSDSVRKRLQHGRIKLKNELEKMGYS